MPGQPILAEYIKSKNLDDLIVVSPDLGGVSRARTMAERLGCGMAIIDKRRPEPGVAEVMNLIGNVEGKTAVLVDDMIDTAKHPKIKVLSIAPILAETILRIYNQWSVSQLFEKHK